MNGLLTWTVYGTWLPGPARGRVDRSGAPRREVLPEPDEALSATRRGSLAWPAVQLTISDRRLIVSDLARIADLRGFTARVATADRDHVHLLATFAGDVPVPRLVQLIKGSLSRTLSAAAGDAPARRKSGAALPHHKWFSSQYSFRRIDDQDELDRVRPLLIAHAERGAIVRTQWS